MYVVTTDKQDTDEIQELFITNPRFNIDEVRRIKALIRFHLKSVTVTKAQDGMEMHNIHTIMKYGRCLSISTIGGALYEMRVRVANKDNDSIYIMRPIYDRGNIHLNIIDAYSIDKHIVNI